MKLQRVRVVLPIIAAAAAVAAVIALPSTAASPPNFDIRASGPVGFDCWEGGGFPTNCNPLAYLIFGTAPASGTHIGGRAIFSTREKSTPISFTENSIDGNAVVTATNGDKIFIHYTGISPAPLPDNMGVGHLDDDLEFSITGGTGRFEDARGGGRLTATGPVYYDGRPTIVSSELAGTIKLHSK